MHNCDLASLQPMPLAMASPHLISRLWRFGDSCGDNDDNIVDDDDGDGGGDDGEGDIDGGYGGDYDGCDDDDNEGDDEDGGEDLRWADYAGSIVILLQGDPWHWQGLDLVITFAPFLLQDADDGDDGEDG